MAMHTTDPKTLRDQAVPIAKALNVIAQATGRSFTMTTEPGRFRIQKTVYLLRHLGYSPARKFEYNLYLKGPYSPGLAQCYYQLGDDGIHDAGSADVPAPILEVTEAALGRSAEFLEGLTTFLDVHRDTPHLPAALARAKAIKVHLPENIWREVRKFIAERPELLTPVT